LKKQPKRIGLAIVGAGRVGLFRGEPAARHPLVDFIGIAGELRGPMREETEQWLNRISMRLPSQHATAAEAHNRLMLTKAFDRSARLKRAVPLPITEE
jgi:hypothetical protein